MDGSKRKKNRREKRKRSKERNKEGGVSVADRRRKKKLKRAREEERNRSGFRYNFSGAEFLDHFETPLRAYEDIEAPLALIAKGLNIPRHELKIFDPYYCRGGVKKHLQKLGFSQVYNENEDFYTSTRFTDFSLFDVVITNPPYSSNHKELCMKWLRRTEKPFFCLMWKFAATKAWYRHGLQSSKPDWYVCPKDKNRYDFKNPSGKGMQGGSPYQPLWFVNTASVLSNYEMLSKIPKPFALTIGTTVPYSSKKKRGNPRQRRKAAEKRKKKTLIRGSN